MAALDVSSGTDAPASRAFNITPGDGADVQYVTRALWIGGAGDIKIATPSGDVVILVGVAAGTLIPIRVSRVYSTSTTATSIVGLY